jgi:predicted NUDIX family phosphoesterase
MVEVSTEHVLVVRTELFHSLGHFQGFSRDTNRYLDELLKPAHISYRPRGQMEEDPSFKQLIPYCVFRHVDPAGRVTVFAYTRGKGQGEGRLRSKRSVGIGGHISSDDHQAGTGNVYQEGLRRELEEEVFIESAYTEQCVGLINDDETPVGQVHLGVVHLFDVEEPCVRPRESELVECGFHPVDQLLADLSGFETWSQICLKALFGRAD